MNSMLTGERLNKYKKNTAIWLILTGLFFIGYVLRGKSYSGELLLLWFVLVIIHTTYLVVRKETLWHLRQQELAIGRRKSKKFLEEVGIKHND